jgi:hypothetical protein
VLAVVALIAATAGWTTVAVLALRPAASASPVAEATPSEDVLPTDEASVEPPAESHEVPALEALLPGELNGTTLIRESWTGETILGDDSWSTSLTSFLTTKGKAAADLQASQAYDNAGSLDINAGAFQVVGVAGDALRDAIIAAWKGDYPDLKVGHTTIGGLEVTTGDFGDGGVASYWYVRDGLVFDIESGDPSIAAAALAALPGPGASGGPGDTPAPSSS